MSSPNLPSERSAWAANRSCTWLRWQLNLFRSGYAVAALTVDQITRPVIHTSQPTSSACQCHLQVRKPASRETTPRQRQRASVNVNATLDRLEKGPWCRRPGSLDRAGAGRGPTGDLPTRPHTGDRPFGTMLGTPLEFEDGTRTWKLGTRRPSPCLRDHRPRPRPDQCRAQHRQAAPRLVERTAPRRQTTSATPCSRSPTIRSSCDPRSGGQACRRRCHVRGRHRALGEPIRTLDIIFKEDTPWLSPANLEPARVQANALLDPPMTSRHRPRRIPLPPVRPPADEKGWVQRSLLAQMLVLPNTQAAPRDYQTLPPDSPPRFEIALDSGKVTNYLAREVAPWVSEDPVRRRIELRHHPRRGSKPRVRRGGRRRQRRAAACAGSPAVPITIPPTLSETRHRVELRNARDGRGPTTSALSPPYRCSSAAPNRPIPPSGASLSG